MGGVVVVWTEGDCEGMCWPVDRPATHAAAGAAARGVRGIGGLFHTPGAWERHNDTELFHPRRCAVSCEAALRILSNGEACPPCGGDSGMTMGGVVVVWTEGVCGGEGLTTGVVRHACRHRVTARGVFGLGGALLPFVLRVVAGACVARERV